MEKLSSGLPGGRCRLQKLAGQMEDASGFAWIITVIATKRLTLWRYEVGSGSVEVLDMRLGTFWRALIEHGSAGVAIHQVIDKIARDRADYLGSMRCQLPYTQDWQVGAARWCTSTQTRSIGGQHGRW